MNLYLFNVPCQEVWTVSTKANSEDEAWKNIKLRRYMKLHAAEGNTSSGKTELVATMALPEGEDEE